MLNCRKLAFAFILILLVTALISSYIVAPFVVEHDCHHDNCFICFYILTREYIEKALLSLVAFVAALALLFFIGSIVVFGTNKRIKSNNLVFLKVKLSD